MTTIIEEPHEEPNEEPNEERPLTLWELLEEYLNDKDLFNQEFNSIAIAGYFGISRHDASMMIQSYVKAQRRQGSRTEYVLTRRGRTGAAVWRVGQRSRDVRRTTAQYLNDIGIKVRNAMDPDLGRMKDLNPRCADLVNDILNVFSASLRLIETQMNEE
jgi:hypothetical protein